MTGLRTLWRRLGGFTAVLMAFAVMFAPVAEAAVCADETPAAASAHADGGAAAAEAAAAVSGDHGSTAPDVGGDLGLCQHGHCHHAAPYLPSLLTEVALPPAAASPIDRLQSQLVRSHRASRLERPPRA